MTLKDRFDGGKLPFNILDGMSPLQIGDLYLGYESLDYLLMLQHSNKTIVSFLEDSSNLDGFFNMIVDLYYPKWEDDLNTILIDYKGSYDYIEDYTGNVTNDDDNTTSGTTENKTSAFNSDDYVPDNENVDTVNLKVDKKQDTIYTKKVSKNKVKNILDFLKVNNDFRLHNIMIYDLIAKMCLTVY